MCEENMKLPEGKTCSDCIQFNYCKEFLSLSGDETNCDWSPSYFSECVASAPRTVARGVKREQGEVVKVGKISMFKV